MIRKYSLGIALVLLGQVAVYAQPAAPQGSPANSPAFSPYLNLLRPTGSPALNYFGIVQPQLQFQQQFNQIQQQNQQFGQQLNSLAYNTQQQQLNYLPLTGHGAVFNFTGHYFNSNPALGGGGGSGRGIGGGFQAPLNSSNFAGLGGGLGAGNGLNGGGLPNMAGLSNRPANNFGAGRPMNNNVFGGGR